MMHAMSTLNGLDRNTIEQIVREVVLKQSVTGSSEPELVVSISARHLHLTDEHVEAMDAHTLLLPIVGLRHVHGLRRLRGEW